MSELKSGKFVEALMDFNRLLRDQANRTRTVLTWADAVFGDKDILAYVATSPQMFVHLIWAYQNEITLSTAPDHLNGQLRRYLAALEFAPEAAAWIAAELISRFWGTPDRLDGELRAWIVLHPKAADTKTHPGVAARLLNLLWNVGDFKAICALIAAGVDTSTPAYVDVTPRPALEGLHSRFIQPLEHLLGNYLQLVDRLHPTGKSQPDDAPLTDEERQQIVRLGALSRGGPRDPSQNYTEGTKKIAGAHQILQALAVQGDAQILTSYADVRDSELVRAFIKEPGTIWGFENVRFPYVQAVHATPQGKHPVRMLEMWAAVQAILDEDTYLRLLTDTDATIKELVGAGLDKLDGIDDPIQYAGLRDSASKKEFRENFIIQCTAYLTALAGRAPVAKFATVSIRGIHLSEYLGAFGCKAGLWWAQQQKMPVYYCLDGVKDTEVIDYKTRKTAEINDFLDYDGNPERFVEVITLAEIREILLHWDDLSDIVKFARKGKFLKPAEVLELASLVMEADAGVGGTRRAPFRDDVVQAAKSAVVVRNTGLPDLDGPPFGKLENDLFYHVVAQLLLLDMALIAKSDQVLASYLATKGARILIHAEVLPKDFGTAYQIMIDQRDANKRKELGDHLAIMVKDCQVPAPLDQGLIEAIQRFAKLS